MTEEQAAADAKKTTELVKLPVVIQGDSKGGPFTIKGEGFGIEKGSLTIGGLAVKITSWTDSRIKGELPNVVGDVVLITPTGTRTGKWPSVKV